ncbi:MAG: 30S ribosomal protein S13 [Chlamydiae bacterium]|nr:30S ribosomal protein S13 [Chlamydiota bacterium]
MPRVIGIDIPGNKRLIISLTYIFGIGRKRSEEIIEKLGLDENLRAHKLTDEEIARLNSLLQGEYVVEGDLRREIQGNIKRLITINCYRGQRHRLGLPVRGQKTQKNARTRKGRVKTVAGKKK